MTYIYADGRSIGVRVHDLTDALSHVLARNAVALHYIPKGMQGIYEYKLFLRRDDVFVEVEDYEWNQFVRDLPGQGEEEGEAEQLTLRQVEWARHQVARWFLVRQQWEQRPVPTSFTQLAADADHSALLYRLLSGKEPLPEPPPLRHGYPDYKAVEEGEDG